MKDVHQKARDRAQQRVASPPLSDIHNTPGSPQVNGNMAFASERERAKEALRTENGSPPLSARFAVGVSHRTNRQNTVPEHVPLHQDDHNYQRHVAAFLWLKSIVKR